MGLLMAACLFVARWGVGSQAAPVSSEKQPSPTSTSLRVVVHDPIPDEQARNDRVGVIEPDFLPTQVLMATDIIQMV